MTLEEKIAHIQAVSMERARAEGNEVIASHKAALEKVFEDHKQEAVYLSETRIKSEETSARLKRNQAMAKAQLNLKRQKGRAQQTLKDKVFREVMELTEQYMKTAEYETFLADCIRKAAEYAGDEEMTIYINGTDAEKKERLEKETGRALTVSGEDFIGGVRSVIRGRNVLIDHSFRTALRNEYDTFVFSGGEELV